MLDKKISPESESKEDDDSHQIAKEDLVGRVKNSNIFNCFQQSHFIIENMICF